MCKLNIRVGTDYLPVKRTKLLHLHCSCFISSVSKSNRSLSPGTVGSFIPTIFMFKKMSADAPVKKPQSVNDDFFLQKRKPIKC